ncbi:MAG: hypothetical protein ACFHU9_14580 [Fluviicola sp.]
MDVLSPYKLILLLTLLIASCSEESKSDVEFTGIELDVDKAFVDAVTMDSLTFASGEKRWLLSGLIVHDGMEYPYSMEYVKNPIRFNVKPVRFSPPNLFNSKDVVNVHLIHQAESIEISWKSTSQFLCVRTVLTSEH